MNGDVFCCFLFFGGGSVLGKKGETTKINSKD